MDYVASNNILLPVPITEHQQKHNKQRIKALTEKISLSGLSRQKAETLNNILFELHEIQIKKFQYSVCVDTIKECSKSWKEVINSDKIDSIILMHKLENVTTFGNGQALLDLKELKKEELNLEESLKLQTFVADKIKTNHGKMVKKISGFSESDVLTPLPYRFHEIKPELLALKQTLNQKQNEYVTALTNLSSTTQKIIDIRGKIQNKIENKIAFLKLQIEICLVKLKITQRKLYNTNFNETPETGKAVDIAIKDLRKETEQLVNKISKMEKELNVIENISPQSELGSLIELYVNYKEEIRRLENLINDISLKHTQFLNSL